MRRTLPIVVSLTLACTETTAPDDDDTSGDDDTDCAVDGSGGSGGAAGRSWLTVAGWSTDADAVPDYEVLVYVPTGLAAPAPLLVVGSNPVQPDRAQIEAALFDDPALDALADAASAVLAFPVGGVIEQNQLAFRTGLDETFFGAALDAVQARWNIDRARIHVFGYSGGGRRAIDFGWRYSTRLASLTSLAGGLPWQDPPESWDRPVPALLIHDPADPSVPATEMQDAADVLADAGCPVETWFDYGGGHGWDPLTAAPRLIEFLGPVCLE